MSTPMIPSVGRKVWFYEFAGQKEPKDATIIKVYGPHPAHPNSAVNLDVIEPDTGAHYLKAGITVGDENTSVWHYRWMPYQIGQAKKQAESDDGK